MKNRLVVLLAGCGLLAIWAYPQIETTYSYWSNMDPGDWQDAPAPAAQDLAANTAPANRGRWIAFTSIRQRAFLTDADFGTRPNIEITGDEIWPKIHSGAIRVPNSYWGYYVQKEVALRWSTQALQSVLILLLAGGLLWVVSGRRALEFVDRGPRR
jgi:hypothetical protein